MFVFWGFFFLRRRVQNGVYRPVESKPESAETSPSGVPDKALRREAEALVARVIYLPPPPPIDQRGADTVGSVHEGRAEVSDEGDPQRNGGRV